MYGDFFVCRDGGGRRRSSFVVFLGKSLDPMGSLIGLVGMSCGSIRIGLRKMTVLAPNRFFFIMTIIYVIHEFKNKSQDSLQLFSKILYFRLGGENLFMSKIMSIRSQ